MVNYNYKRNFSKDVIYYNLGENQKRYIPHKNYLNNSILKKLEKIILLNKVGFTRDVKNKLEELNKD
ncbi:MAG: hypothetical protein AABX80_02505 [Nanoarchaeota archaeon]